MLTPEYLASFSSRYLGMVDNLNEQIVRDIARRMIKTGKVTDTAKWQIKQAQESGKLLDDIVAEVGRFTGYSDKHVKELFKEAGVTGIRNDAKPLIDAGIINDAKLSKNMSDLLLANAKKTSGDINNLTMTTAVKSQQLYMQSLNEALLKIQSGAFSYQEALRYAIRKAAQAGGMVLYDSGAQMSLDAALRMALLTGLNQTVATLTEMYADDMGVEYYETTAHPGARLEHTYWQGQVFKIHGEGDGYRNFYDATGYGTVTGLCGANCRHSFYPYWPGISKPAYTKEMLDDYSVAKFSYDGNMLTEYECSQIQRRFERAIRESKRILCGYDSAIQYADDTETEQYLKNEFQKESVKLKKREKKLKNFCSETGRSVDTARTQVYAVKDQNGNIVNYGRSGDSKIQQAATEKATSDSKTQQAALQKVVDSAKQVDSAIKASVSAANQAASNANQAANLAADATSKATSATANAVQATKDAKAATTAANKAEEQRTGAETSRVQAEETRNHTFTQWTAEEEKWSENETTRIQNETKRQADTADAIAKAKEATELLVNQANTIAFRINEGDSGLDVVILSA